MLKATVPRSTSSVTCSSVPSCSAGNTWTSTAPSRARFQDLLELEKAVVEGMALKSVVSRLEHHIRGIAPRRGAEQHHAQCEGRIETSLLFIDFTPHVRVFSSAVRRLSPTRSSMRVRPPLPCSPDVGSDGRQRFRRLKSEATGRRRSVPRLPQAIEAAPSQSIACGMSNSSSTVENRNLLNINGLSDTENALAPPANGRGRSSPHRSALSALRPLGDECTGHPPHESPDAP